MSNNVKMFPRHKLSRCDGECDGCFVCMAGLALCETCGGAEASLPTHCPQQKMSVELADAVQDGELDFIDGRWMVLMRGGFLREVFDA